MNEENWKLEWYWLKEHKLLTIHIFPHRTFLIKTEKLNEQIIPYLAGLCCFNVLLGQNTKKNITVESTLPLPNGLTKLSKYLKNISDEKYSIEFNNISTKLKLRKLSNNILLFSGGKDSVWQLSYLKKNKKDKKLELLYVGGPTIAGEYVQELSMVNKLKKNTKLNLINVEHFDYTNIGLSFKYRPRWRSLLLITLARIFSDEIWTGISVDDRHFKNFKYIKKEKLNLFSENPEVIKILAKMLNCNIWLSPPESYCFFDIEKNQSKYRSCYSPDIECDPVNDFKDSCWKCRTLHIYKQIGKEKELTKEEKLYYNCNSWMGDQKKDIVKYTRNSNNLIKPKIIRGKK